MSILIPLLLSAGLLTASASAADRLSVGDPAPALSIEHFVKGERLDGFPADKVTVVEFWATWCKPCIAGFPHLSELQEQYADELVIVGVSDEKLATVEPFLAKPKYAEVTRYRVATDPDGSMQADWMKAAEQRGIPCAFIVDRAGIVQYIGHPMAMDAVLERVITGAAPEAPAAPRMSDEERAQLFGVDGSHSEAALAAVDGLRARLSAAGGRLSFEQELLLRGAMRMGGPDGEAMDLRKTREGELWLGGARGDRLDATRSMHLPGMPGMTESESVLFDGEQLLVKFASGSPFMPSPLPTSDWTRITRSEATALAEESVMPVPMALLMDVSPHVAHPLDALDALLDMSALAVVSELDGLLVLEGPAAPMAGVPTPDSADAAGDPVPTRLRLEFRRDGGPLSVQVGDPEQPSLSMRLEWHASEGELDASLFDAGDAEPAALLPILRERLQAMRGMSAPANH